MLTEEHHKRSLCESRHQHAYNDRQHPDEDDGYVSQTEGEQIQSNKTSDENGGADRRAIANEDFAPAQRLIEFIKCEYGQTPSIDKR